MWFLPRRGRNSTRNRNQSPGSLTAHSVCRTVTHAIGLRKRFGHSTSSSPISWSRTDPGVPTDLEGRSVCPGLPPGDILPLAFRSAWKNQDRRSSVGSSTRQTARSFAYWGVKTGHVST